VSTPTKEATEEGPALEALLGRQRATPPEYWETPGAVVDTVALWLDLVEDAGGERPDAAALRQKVAAATAEGSNLMTLLQMAAWLVADAWFAGRGDVVAAAPLGLLDALAPLAKHVRYADVGQDEERREEFVRVVLAALGLRPAGETPARAADRLAALDSAQRAEVAVEARKAHERAQQVAREIARKAEEAAAAKVSRE
jgi:hypothetical protein